MARTGKHVGFGNKQVLQVIFANISRKIYNNYNFSVFIKCNFPGTGSVSVFRHESYLLQICKYLITPAVAI
jgi:hypothetical protein